MNLKLLVFLLILTQISIDSLYAQTETKLTALDPGSGDQFGFSVSLSGDYALIGASGTSSNGEQAGSAYIVKQEGGTWVVQTELLPADPNFFDFFGNSVSLSGDYALIGASGDSDNGSSSGSAYIFKREGIDWSEQAKLTASDAAEGDIFGQAVSLSGDYAIAGAWGDDDNGANSGAAYIFRREGSAWIEEAKLTASDAAEADNFGFSVFLDGDYAVIGARQDDDNGLNSGSAYIFKREGSTWVEQAKLISSDGENADFFGKAVSLNGDYAVVGAWQAKNNGISSGSAYIFKREGVTWAEEAKLTASDQINRARFGDAVSLNGDIALIGAPQSASAYIFKREGTSWVEETKLTPSDPLLFDQFGFSVALSSKQALVGVWNSSMSGSSYIYDLSGIVEGVSIEEDGNVLADDFKLEQNYPNPFSSTTTFPYKLESAVHVQLEIFDLFGQHVTTLVDTSQPQGEYNVTFDASGLSSGVYMYRLSTGSVVSTKLLILVK